MLKGMNAAACICLVSVMMCVGCSGNRQPAAEGNPTISNSEIVTRTIAKLDSDPEVQAARVSVDSDASQRQVTLSGAVKSEDVHQKAVQLAGNAMPGIQVVDKISVEPQELARTSSVSAKNASKHAGRPTTAKGRHRR